MCKFKFKLSFLIVSIVMVSILATSTISIWGSYQSFNEILIENKRDLKEVYRKEISNITNDYGQLEMQDSDNGIASHAAFEQAANRFLEENTVPFNALFKKIIFPLALALLVSFVLTLWIAVKIIRPLKGLATGIEGGGKIQNLEEIDGWYLEAYHLKNAVLNTLTESRNRIADLTKQLRLDSLTGIPNRRSMDQVLNELFTNKVPHAIVLIDLDNFKNVNDTYGHTAGDEVLKAFAKIMQESVNQHGVCFRYGGEEFMIILPSTTIEEAVEVAENLRVKQALAENLFGHPVTLSAGITAFSTAIKTPKQLIAIADQALYEAKKSGRNCICVVEEFSGATIARRQL
ncbi:GGDEF domain-containing protein [Lysinibacillus parviboronicapiens]|uniref:GGDEF domain-containing protein n=1 Tax=Lysinibacillus parviboronicapiens TaxID=436516 RepID=UPI000D3C7052|nr:GGDEF domain-containing protein [Lysinibacillus parviboronicapiens]